MSARESISGRTEPKLNDLGVVIGVVMIRFISWSPRAVIKRFRLDEDETSTNLIDENHGLTPLSDPDNFHPVVIETIDRIETKTPLKEWLRMQAGLRRGEFS